MFFFSALESTKAELYTFLEGAWKTLFLLEFNITYPKRCERSEFDLEQGFETHSDVVGTHLESIKKGCK